MWKTCWLNAVLLYRTNLFVVGVSSSDHVTSAHLKDARDGLAMIGTATRCFVSIEGTQHYLWRAVDQDGDVLDILIQKRRDRQAAERFFRKVLKGQGREPRRVVSDGLKSYLPAIYNVLPSALHDKTKYANNRAENSHQHTRRRERQMQWFKSSGQAQRLLGLHARVGNLFRYGRHLMKAKHHRLFRDRAFAVWSSVTYA